MIPYGRQSIDESDVAAVVEVLRGDWLTQGPAVPGFEDALCAYTGAAHAVAVCNGTAALHVACLALGLGPRGRLWTSPNSFVASANCGLYCGAEVGFVDIEPDTFCMSADALEAALLNAEKTDALPDIVVPVHHSGLPCDMPRIAELARRFGFRVIEDACHALGAKCGADAVGNGRYSDATVFSFHPVKSLTTGEGGAVMTNDPELAERMRLLRSHGITRDPSLMSGEAATPWYYEQVELGFNYRITDLQCALGTSQIARLDSFVDRRLELAARYDELLADLPLSRQAGRSGCTSARHLYVVRMDAGVRDRVGTRLRDEGVGVNLHYAPIHLQPYYRSMGFGRGDFPQAEAYGADALTIPLHPGLTEAEQDEVASRLRHALEG